MIINFDSIKKGEQISADNFKYQLAQALLPKEKWMSDEFIKSCVNCDKTFIYFLRRKHHCRRCGQVFCSDCSENFLDGIFFSEDSEKQVRFCIKCYDQLTKYLKKRNVEIQASQNVISVPVHKEQIFSENKPPTNQRPSYASQSTEVEYNQELEFDNIQALFADDDKQNLSLNMNVLDQTLQSMSHQKIDQICQFLCQRYDIMDWQDIMQRLIKQSVEEIGINSIQNEPMDINYYVKIKKIIYSDKSLTSLVRGVVFRKNVTHRRMRQQLKDPKVMILLGNLDLFDTLDNSGTQFESVVNNEKKEMRKLADKIISFQPDIIFVEKQANRLATEMLQQANITITQNVKPSILSKIARITKAKPCPMNKIEVYTNPEKIIGKCNSIQFRQFNSEMLVQNKKLFQNLPESIQNQIMQHVEQNKSKDKTLLFLESQSGISGITIILSGPNFQQLQLAKRSMMGILRLARHFYLERYMILTEKRLKHKLLKNSQNININQLNATTGDLTKFIYERIQLEDLIKKDYLQYTKINFVSADLSHFNDVKDNHELENYLKESLLIQQTKLDFFAEVCQAPFFKKVEFYSKDDTSLGAFILLKVSNMENKCEFCKQPRHAHVSLYYGSGTYIKITVESNFFLAEENNEDQQQENPGPNPNTNTNSNGQQEDQNVFLTHKDVLKKLALKHKTSLNKHLKIIIETYLECNICGEKLTEEVRLSKINMEYSFLRFLQHLFISGIGAQEFQNLQSECDHAQVSRVFTYEQTMVKFYVYKFNTYSVNQIKEEEQIEKIKNTQMINVARKKEELLNKIDYISQKLVQLLPTEIKNEKAHNLLIQSDLGHIIDYIMEKKQEFEEKVSHSRYSNIFEYENDNYRIGLNLKSLSEQLITVNKLKEIPYQLKKLIDQQLKHKSDSFDKQQSSARYLDTQIVKRKLHRNNSVQIKLGTFVEEPKKKSLQTNLEAIRDEGSVKSDIDSFTDLPTQFIIQNAQREGRNSLENLENMSSEKLSSSGNLLQDSVRIDFNFIKEWNLASFHKEQEQNETALQKYDFVPLYEQDHISYIAFALNHSKYMHQVYFKEGFQTYEDDHFPDFDNQDQIEFIHSKLHECKQESFSIKIYKDQSQKNLEYSPIPNESEIKSPIQGAPQKQKYSEIIIHYPSQFEALRMCNKIKLSQFIKSVYSMSSWDTSGGKSESLFFKSEDDMFIIKKFPEGKETSMFQKFAMDYFNHMWRLCYENKPSLLGKIFGMFEVKEKGNVGYYLIMEYLYAGMPKEVTVYDLKGSETNRWIRNQNNVLLDTNFRIDRNAEPIPVIKDNFRFIDRAFQVRDGGNDSKFLFKHNVIDYSLLLIIDKSCRKIKLGIIDYLRQYTWDKKIENNYKLVAKRGQVFIPTIVNPHDYKKRFLEAMGKYFIEANTEY